MIAAFLMVGATMLAAEAPAVDWQTNCNAAWMEARQTQRPLLVVIDVPGEAGTAVRQISLRPDPVQQEALAPYVKVRVDGTSKYGKMLAEHYGATSVPYTLISHPGNGGVVFRKAGQFADTEWTNALLTHAERRVVESSYSYPAGSFYPSNNRFFGGGGGYCPNCR